MQQRGVARAEGHISGALSLGVKRLLTSEHGHPFFKALMLETEMQGRAPLQRQQP